MKRREYLATAAALFTSSLAGCADPEAVLQMDEVSEADIATRASRDVDPNPEARDVVSTAVTDGSATVTGRSPPVKTGRPIAFEGGYYDLTVTETGQRQITEYEILVDYDAGTGTPDGPVIDYDDLPSVDQEALDALLPPPDDAPSGDGYDFGVGQEYDEEAADQSVLVPDQEYDAVVYEGTPYRIQAGDGRSVTVSDYRYEAEEIATDTAEFADWIRSEYLFTLSGLSSDENAVVEEAIEDGYYEGDTTDAFESLVERFRTHSAIEVDEWGGDWLVRYEGTVYWAELRHPPSVADG